MYILCHKCSGVLAKEDKSDAAPLYGCQCISGWIRGFEPHLSHADASREQVRQELEWLALAISQGRPDGWNPARLVVAMKACPDIGHGTIKWAELVK